MDPTPNLHDMWAHVLSLCALRAGERVVVVEKQGEPSRYSQVILDNCATMGADVTPVEASDRGALPNSTVPQVANADLVIDFLFVLDPRLFRPIPERGQGGARVLVVLEPPEILARLLPQARDKERARNAQALLGAAATMRVTSPSGTDFAAQLGQFPPACQFGYADEPGHWDQWPGVFAYIYPTDHSAGGRIVLASGDIILPRYGYIREPIHLDIEGGYIRSIAGGLDAELLEDHLLAYDDPEVFAVSHLGWGLSHKARWSELALYEKSETEGQDGRAFYGNFLFSTGPNISAGGSRAAACHLDIPMRGCSVSLDDRPVVVEGDVVVVALKP